MAAAPPALVEDPPRFIDRDTFTMRREILPQTTPRSPRSHPKFLPRIFEGAHPWPLAWGGPEVHEAHWNAHKDINAGFQKRLENAGRRFAERLQGTGVRLFARVVATRYP